MNTWELAVGLPQGGSSSTVSGSNWNLELEFPNWNLEKGNVE